MTTYHDPLPIPLQQVFIDTLFEYIVASEEKSRQPFGWILGFRAGLSYSSAHSMLCDMTSAAIDARIYIKLAEAHAVLAKLEAAP